MKHLWLFALLFFLLRVPLSAQTQDYPDTSGNAFLRLCSGADKENKTDADYGHVLACTGYITGFVSGVDYERSFAHATTNRSVPLPFCTPDNVENGQLIRVVLKFIRDNPADANKPTAWLIMDALGKAYPCPSK